MRILALAVLLVLPALGAGAAARLPTAQFLESQPDARALAMGEAGQADAEGARGLTVNPASLLGVKAHELYFTHSIYGNGIGADHAAYAGAFGAHRFALAYRHLGYGTLEGRDDSGSLTGGFSPGDTVMAASYGTTAGRLKAGATIKRVESKIVSTARTTAFDLGARWDSGEEWSLGASGHNLGGRLRFDRDSDPLPARAAFGGAWRPAGGWTLAADLVTPLYSPAYAALGAERSVRLKDHEDRVVSFRIGFNTKTPDAGRFAGLKAGAGARFGPVEADYAFGPGGDIADSHLFAITYRFGTPSGEKGPRER